MAGKGGGAWKVAYADFVTAMMAFFLVMWITAQSKPVKEAVAGYFKDPTGSGRPGHSSAAPGGAGAGERTGKKYPNGLDRKKPGKKSTRPNPAVDPTLIAVHDGDTTLAGTVLNFDELSADLSPEAKDRLDQMLPVLAGKPNKIELRGHATRRPLPPGSPFSDVWELSYARCVTAMKYLENAGIEAERIRMSQAGPYEPETIRLEGGWQRRNSRVEIYVLPESTEDLMGTKQERSEFFRALPRHGPKPTEQAGH